jgi:iron complex outermembrane receptor protein
MAAEMIGWFGDGNGYVGSVDLKPEQANIFSLTTGWHDSAKKDWNVKVTPFYNYIRNYIGVDYLGSNGMMGPKGSSLLKFANHDAMTYGLELTAEKSLLDESDFGHIGIAGTSGLQRGYTINDGNSLYHLMPLTLSVTLNHQLGGWSNALEVKATSSKSEADPLRHEPFTPGFAVVNFRTAYEWRNLRLDGGIDNLLNQQYYSPLGGMDLADWKVAGGSSSVTPRPLAAPGRSYNAGVTVKF